jgi:hypothetical protein
MTERKTSVAFKECLDSKNVASEGLGWSEWLV